jgi:hypothetical protein
MMPRSHSALRSPHAWLRLPLALLSVAAGIALSSACSSYFGTGPDPARDGRVDAGAAGAAGVVPSVLVANISVSALALDANNVYFTSNQGLAKVAKSGGSAMPLGGFSQLDGLALDSAAIYAVNSSGSLFSVHKDGSGAKSLASSMCSGGSGAVLLDAGDVFFTTGPYLRTTSVTGAALSDLTADVWQGGGPTMATRLAVDTRNVYYVGNPSIGGQGAVYGVSRASATASSCMGQTSRGTRVATAQGSVAGLTGDGSRLYFTDLTSNGLSPVLLVSAVLTPSLAASTVTVLARLEASGTNAPNLGGALASDGTYLYFAGFSGIYRVPLRAPGCQVDAGLCADPELVIGGAQANALAVDDDFLYYADQNGPSGLKKIAK